MDYSIASVILLLGLTIGVLTQEVEPEHKKTFLSNCFFEDKRNTCESKFIKIGDHYYGCNSQVPFDYEVRKIGFVGEDPGFQMIQVEDSNENSFIFDKDNSNKISTDLPKLQSCVIITDDHENSYNLEDGKAFIKSKNGVIREIILEDDYTAVELFKDPATKQLIILSTKDSPKGAVKGVLGVVPLITSKKDSGKTTPVIAQTMSPSNVIITGLSIYEGLDDLILAVKINNAFKVVTISKLDEDPCKNEKVKSLRDIILDIVQETQSDMVEKIAQECEFAALSNRKTSHEGTFSIDTRSTLRNYIDEISDKLASAEKASNDNKKNTGRTKTRTENHIIDMLSEIKETLGNMQNLL